MIASLGGVEYFEGQCLAFLKNPQTNPQNEQYIPGVFSYQENKISFSFMVSGEIKEIHSLQYETLYIVDNKKRYTLYKPYNRIILGHVLGYPTPITFYYEQPISICYLIHHLKQMKVGVKVIMGIMIRILSYNHFIFKMIFCPKNMKKTR
ncbi:hypothetical protein VN0338_09060 [Helicobacter pylori]|nr:hypothetical protein VN0338_09060 [Helicobacter pylori]